MNIYLGNLPRTITEDQIKDFVSEHGEVTSVKIVMDRITNAPRGFAFIEMPVQDEATKFIEEQNGAMFEGRRLTVSEARQREEGPRRSFGGGGGGGSRGGFNRDDRGPRRFNNDRF